MDEEEQDARIAATFRAAAADAPPAGFEVGDVVAASHRATRRRRAALAGAGLAVLALVGVGVTAAGLSGGRASSDTVAAASSAGRAPEESGAVAGDARAAAPSVAAAPQAAGSSPVGAPLGPGTRECADRQDPALRVLVEQVLPEVAGAPEAAVTLECRPGGERGLALEVRDGGAAGVLSATYLPPGTADAAPPGAVTAPTASGGTVVVSSRPERGGEPAPFADRLGAVIAHLAPRL